MQFVNMNFGQALEIMKHGGSASREAWTGRDQIMFACLIPEQTVLGDLVRHPYLAAQRTNEPVAAWMPSSSDLLAEDWKMCHVPPQGVVTTVSYNFP